MIRPGLSGTGGVNVLTRYTRNAGASTTVWAFLEGLDGGVTNIVIHLEKADWAPRSGWHHRVNPLSIAHFGISHSAGSFPRTPPREAASHPRPARELATIPASGSPASRPGRWRSAWLGCLISYLKWASRRTQVCRLRHFILAGDHAKSRPAGQWRRVNRSR